MANVYVRQGATGSNNGTDWTNAFTTVPTGTARGNTLYIADGTYSSTTFDTTESGTTLITIKKATIADHGTSTGWLDTYGDGTATFSGSVRFARDYYVFDGVSRNEVDWDSQVYGFKILGGSLSSWPNNFPPGGDHIVAQYIDVGGVVGTSFGDVGFSTDEPLYLVHNTDGQTVSDWTVSRCFFHNATLAQLDRVDGITIEYCLFKDLWAKEAIRGQDKAKNCIVRYNKFEQTTQDTGLPGETGTAPIAVWDEGSEPAGSFDNWQIYGNLFWDNTPVAHSHGTIGVGNGGSLDGIIANNVKIYNNTVVNYSAGLGSGMTTSTSGGATGNEIRNNLFYNCLGTPTCSPDTSSNGEASSDPFVNYAGSDFHLSAHIAGTSLSSPYNVDMDGNIRGADGTFDRGTFQFEAADDITFNVTNMAFGALRIG